MNDFYVFCVERAVNAFPKYSCDTASLGLLIDFNHI